MAEQKAMGKITEIKGPVIDARFEKGSMPKVNDALRIEREGQKDLILEVAQHLGDDVVRAARSPSRGHTPPPGQAMAMAADLYVSRGVEAASSRFQTESARRCFRRSHLAYRQEERMGVSLALGFLAVFRGGAGRSVAARMPPPTGTVHHRSRLHVIPALCALLR